MHQLILFWFHLLKDWGYVGIVLLMAMESSIFPVPSEVVMPPAAYWAVKGQMNYWGVIAAGTLGSYLGSAITYWVSAGVGRLVILKWGRWIHLTEDKLLRAESMIKRYEAGGVFFSRLLPVIRHLISIPAGIVRMPFGLFSAVTITGSFIWCWTLCWFGARMARNNPELIDNPEAMVAAIKHDSLPIVLFAVLFTGLYIVAMRLTRKAPAQSTSA